MRAYLAMMRARRALIFRHPGHTTRRGTAGPGPLDAASPGTPAVAAVPPGAAPARSRFASRDAKASTGTADLAASPSQPTYRPSRTRTAVLFRRRVPIFTAGSSVQPRQRGSQWLGRGTKGDGGSPDNGPLSRSPVVAFRTVRVSRTWPGVRRWTGGGVRAHAESVSEPPSQLTLAGLLYHLSLVEEDWMEVRFAGLPDREPWASVDWESDPDWEFRTAAQLEPEQLQDRYRQACERSRHVVSSAAGLDQLSARALRDGRHFALRWVLLHLIEETARHAGHADFLREAIDGTAGE